MNSKIHRLALSFLLFAAIAPLRPARAEDAPSSSDSLAHPVTLDEALAAAERNAVAVIQAQGQVRTTQAGVRSAYGAFLPSIDLTAGASRQLPAGTRNRVVNGEVFPPTPWSGSFGYGASVTLFSGGARLFDLRQAKAQAGAAVANEEAQHYDTALNVKQSFFNILAAKETEAAARAQLAEAEQNARTAMAKVRARMATRSDSLRAEIQLQNARLAVAQAANSTLAADATLTRAIGASQLVTASQESAQEPVTLALDEAALAGLAAKGPAVREATLNLQAASAAKKITWTDYLPSLTASYSRSGNGAGSTMTSGFQDNTSYSGAFRLSASLPIFDQFNRESRVTQASVAATNAEAALRDARLASQETLVHSLGNFRTAAERVAAQSVTVQAAEEDLRVQQERYAVGASTILDVLTSQAALDQARLNLIQARYDQRIAKAQIEALVGRSL